MFFPKTRLTVSFVFIVSLTIPGAQRARGQDPGKEVLSSIVSAWKERQNVAQSFDFVATGTEWRSAAVIDERQLAMAGQKANEKLTLPETSFPITIRLVLDKLGRARFQYDGKDWSAKEKGYVPTSQLDMFDGKTQKTFFGQGAIGFPNAHVSRGDVSTVARDERVLPILIAYRTLDSALGVLDLEGLRLDDAKGVVGEHTCLIVIQGEHTVWVDPARGYLPIRYYGAQNGKVQFSLEMQYSQDKNNAWVLSAWTNGTFSMAGALTSSVTVKVSESRLNVPIPDEMFDFGRLPQGTWLRNYITDEAYILRQDGEKRPVRPGEYNGENYQQLLTSDSPDREYWGGQGWRTFWAACGIAVVLLVLVLIFLYRRRTRA